ncbi:PREDICTED: uncharacterized protein LOC109468890 [Branchiostoma belcheri]|uniref:Uncharacterized protein LOC109468890 n=1 Tax=Branchiostoma belcheri TaxID=7741 RepID=A0A6P4YZT5_BRABE|nr:PREDICTED: uncharacterized protein LOC109468890 [Branchiostoma belcheri]
MSPRSAGVLCLLAVLLCCCINGSVAAQKKSKEQLLSQVDSVVKNLKTMNSKRGLGEEHVSRSSLGQLYMTELEVQRALLADPDDLDLQEGMKELKSLEKDLTGRGGANIPQIRNKADVPGALAKIIKEREQLFSQEQANQIVR